MASSSSVLPFAGYGIPCAVTLYNHHVLFPVITSISPSVVSLVGSNITLTGANFHPTMQIVIDQRLCTLHTLSTSHATFLAVNASSESWSNTYHAMSLVNPDGGAISCPPECDEEEELFYVDACPVDGQNRAHTQSCAGTRTHTHVDTIANCTFTCCRMVRCWSSVQAVSLRVSVRSVLSAQYSPPHSSAIRAECPGGFRAWPKQSFWSSGESLPGRPFDVCVFVRVRVLGSWLNLLGPLVRHAPGLLAAV